MLGWQTKTLNYFLKPWDKLKKDKNRKWKMKKECDNVNLWMFICRYCHLSAIKMEDENRGKKLKSSKKKFN